MLSVLVNKTLINTGSIDQISHVTPLKELQKYQIKVTTPRPLASRQSVLQTIILGFGFIIAKEPYAHLIKGNRSTNIYARYFWVWRRLANIMVYVTNNDKGIEEECQPILTVLLSLEKCDKTNKIFNNFCRHCLQVI